MISFFTLAILGGLWAPLSSFPDTLATIGSDASIVAPGRARTGRRGRRHPRSGRDRHPRRVRDRHRRAGRLAISQRRALRACLTQARPAPAATRPVRARRRFGPRGGRGAGCRCGGSPARCSSPSRSCGSSSSRRRRWWRSPPWRPPRSSRSSSPPSPAANRTTRAAPGSDSPLSTSRSSPCPSPRWPTRPTRAGSCSSTTRPARRACCSRSAARSRSSSRRASRARSVSGIAGRAECVHPGPLGLDHRDHDLRDGRAATDEPGALRRSR